MRIVFACLIVATLAAICCGCGTIHTPTRVEAKDRRVARDSTREDLLQQYNSFAETVKSLNATMELRATTGSQYSKVIDEYHEVKVFVLAARPGQIRMIGQAPVIGKNVFDMASDGETFRVSIPSKNKFIVGKNALDKMSEKPIENLRPQHLVDALLWPPVHKAEAVLFEEFNDENSRYYVLTVLRGGDQKEILRKIWFDRAAFQVARIQNDWPKGALVSDARFANWQPVVGDQEHSGSAGSPASASAMFPTAIQLERPHDDYRLDLQVSKVALNQELGAERFKLEQPAGSELVRV